MKLRNKRLNNDKYLTMVIKKLNNKIKIFIGEFSWK